MNALISKDKFSRENLRKQRRELALKSAQIIYGGPWSAVIDCLVVDLTSDGARIETMLALDVPSLFVLKFSDGSERRARKCWSSGCQIGAEFIEDKN